MSYSPSRTAILHAILFCRVSLIVLYLSKGIVHAGPLTLVESLIVKASPCMSLGPRLWGKIFFPVPGRLPAPALPASLDESSTLSPLRQFA